MSSPAWQVLVLFLIPIGGGIPAGVVYANTHGVSWPMMSGIYFISDVILACVFEPLMLLFLKHSEFSPRLLRFRQALALMTAKTVGRLGPHLGPWSLVMITFGTDPMTGRSVAKALGHGFLSGWALTIAGDMIFFLVIMASTLWLNNVLGDGTWTILIIMAAMFGIPEIIRAYRRHRRA